MQWARKWRAEGVIRRNVKLRWYGWYVPEEQRGRWVGWGQAGRCRWMGMAQLVLSFKTWLGGEND